MRIWSAGPVGPDRFADNTGDALLPGGHLLDKVT
jgi:hypothetical protein